jgi:type IV pilus assembly protein PilC
MAKYRYEARSFAGKVTNGVLEARDEAEARVRLRARQLVPLKLTIVQIAQKNESSSVSFFSPKVNSKELQIFTRQFATLINAGIPILDALKILSDGSTDKIIKEAVIQIRAAIETGKRLSESMAMHPRAFDALFCNMIKAGEEAGILDQILERLSTYSEKNEKVKNQIKGALVMPVVIVCAAVVIILGIIIFIIPKFAEFYRSSGKPLPGLTQMVVSLSESFATSWYIYVAATFATVYMAVNFFSTKEGKIVWDEFIINAPIIGGVVQKASVARMTRTLSTLLSSGINMIEAIDIAAKTSGNHVIEKALNACKDSVTVGKAFYLPLSRQKEIPQMVSQMVAIGEQSGTLDTMLGKVADFYEDEVENAVRAMTSLIEPLLMVGLGAVIAFILIAMYLPIFQLGDTVG